MAEATATTETATAAEPVALTAEDWKNFQDRQGAETDFYDVSFVTPPERGGGEKEPSGDANRQTTKADGGDDDPAKKTSVEADGQPKSEKPGEGDGDPTKKSPEADGALPPGVARRLRRQSDKHAKALAAERTEQDSLKARIAALEAQVANVGSQTDKTGGAGDGKPEGATKTPAEMDWKEQYEALALLDVGPDPGDYSDTRKWTEDFDLWIENKPLKNHPKLGEATAAKPDGGKTGGATETGAAPKDTGGNKPTDDEARAAAAKEWTDRQWRTLEAAFEENEDKDPKTELGTDVYDSFLNALEKRSFGLSPEALEHIANSETGPELAKMLVDSPAKAMRLFNKPTKAQAEELDKMLERTRKRAEGGDGDGTEKPNSDRGGKVMPKVEGAGAGGGTVNPEDMSMGEYTAWREAQMKDSGGGFYLR